MNSISFNMLPPLPYGLTIDGLIKLHDSIGGLTLKNPITYIQSRIPCKLESIIARICVSGSATLRINGVDYPMRPKSMLLTAPYVILEQFETTDDLQVILLAAPPIGVVTDKDDGTIQRIMSRLYSCDGVESIQLSDDEYERFTRLYISAKECIGATSEEFRHIAAKGFISMASAFIASALDEPVQSDSQHKGIGIEKVLLFLSDLQTYGKTEHRLSFYASRCCVSEKHFGRLVKKQTGKSPGQMIQERLVLEAQVLLAAQKKTVDAIADELRFPSSQAFQQWYRNRTGKTPAEYRRERKRLAEPLEAAMKK